MNRGFAALLLAAVWTHATNAVASPWIADAERGNGVQLVGIANALLDRRDVHPSWGWSLDRLWVARLAYWRAEHPEPYGRHLWDLSLMPTLRWGARAPEGPRPFFEAALGAHLLSTTRIDNRPLSTAFQFGEQLAVGFRVPAPRPMSVSLRAEHVSNGGIKHPNSGVTFAGLRVQVELP